MSRGTASVVSRLSPCADGSKTHTGYQIQLAASKQGVCDALLMRIEPGSIPGRPAKSMRLSYSNWQERRLQTVGMWVRILRGAPHYGSVAQSGEHDTVNVEVAGSKPVWSAKLTSILYKYPILLWRLNVSRCE